MTVASVGCLFLVHWNSVCCNLQLTTCKAESFLPFTKHQLVPSLQPPPSPRMLLVNTCTTLYTILYSQHPHCCKCALQPPYAEFLRQSPRPKPKYISHQTAPHCCEILEKSYKYTVETAAIPQGSVAPRYYEVKLCKREANHI